MTNNQIMTNEEYKNYVKSFMPKTNEWRSLFNSFLVGGFICSIGQFIRYFFNLVFKNIQRKRKNSVTLYFYYFISSCIGSDLCYSRRC